MRYSQLFTKTLKTLPKETKSKNAQLLIKAGFVEQVAAGIYSFLPLGLRVLKKIEKIIRQEMKKIGAQEILMPNLHPKNLWQTTQRWNQFDALYKLKSREEREYALGATHEEVVVPLAKNFIQSYKDLPFAVFQIQKKFRDEKRAKSGLLRGREFIMKDLYSFHQNKEDLNQYYLKVKKTYRKIFKQCGLEAKVCQASGGTFSKYSHEFQVLTSAGEDIILYCSCGFAQNQEIFQEKRKECHQCGKDLQEAKTVEVGNIFKLGTKYSEPFRLTFRDQKGKEQKVLMGCYGIGVDRLMGAIVEVHHDKQGILWPEKVTPYKYHLLALDLKNKQVKEQAEKVYQILSEKEEVFYDDRHNISAGKKFADADLMGMPYRLVISPKTKGKIEVKKRGTEEVKLINPKLLHSYV